MEGEGSSKNNYKNASTIYITQSRDTLNQGHNQKFKMAQICRLNCPLFSFGACDLPAMTVKLYVAFFAAVPWCGQVRAGSLMALR